MLGYGDECCEHICDTSKEITHNRSLLCRQLFKLANCSPQGRHSEIEVRHLIKNALVAIAYCHRNGVVGLNLEVTNQLTCANAHLNKKLQKSNDVHVVHVCSHKNFYFPA